MRIPGDLHGASRRQLRVRGLAVTESGYSPGLRIDRHDHEAASVTFVLAGGYVERFGSNERRARPGLVIIHPEGERHAEVHDPVETVLLTIEVGGDLLREWRTAVRALNESSDWYDVSAFGLVHRLRAELVQADQLSAAVIETLAVDLLGGLERARVSSISAAPWLAAVRHRLHDEPGRLLSMRGLAEFAGVHPIYLARAFRRRFGCSIGAYVRQLQVGRALLAIERDEKSLASIACAEGFADQSHMTRLIRDATGLTPGAWRRRASVHGVAGGSRRSSAPGL